MTFKQATGIFWIAVLIHAVVWTLLPGLLHSGYKPDVIEQLFIGREWVLASSRHPALPAIMLELTNMITGRAFLSPFLVSQICMTLTIWAVWKLGRAVLSPFGALAASLSMLLYWFFTIEAVKYNQNIPYIAFWALSVLFVHEAVRTNKIGYWILAGITLGLDLQCKFSSVLLILSILIFFALDSRARKSWKTFSPYLTTIIALLVFLPQILWLIFKQDVPVPSYIADPIDIPLRRQFYLMSRFLLSQIGFLIFPLSVLLLTVQIPLKRKTDRTPDQQWSCRFLAAMILLPLLEHALIGFGYLDRINADYGAPIWSMSSVWFLLFFQPKKELALPIPTSTKPVTVLKQLGAAVIIIEISLIIAFVIQSCFSPYLLGRPRRFHFPMRALGTACEKIWSEHASDSCPYTTGDWWIAGNAAEGMRPSPSVHAIGGFENFEIDDTPTIWSTDSDVNQHGGLVLWNNQRSKGAEPVMLQKRFPKAIVLKPLIIPYEKFKHIPPVEIGIAIVLPEKED